MPYWPWKDTKTWSRKEGHLDTVDAKKGEGWHELLRVEPQVFEQLFQHLQQSLDRIVSMEITSEYHQRDVS